MAAAAAAHANDDEKNDFFVTDVTAAANGVPAVVTIELRRAPLEGGAGKDELRTMFRRIVDAYLVHERIRLKLFASGVTGNMVRFRRLIVSFIKDNKHLHVRHLERTAIVIVNPAVRAFIKLVLKLAGTATPVQVFAKLDKADIWISDA